MAFDLFCLTKSSKSSSRKSAAHKANRSNSYNGGTNNANNANSETIIPTDSTNNGRHHTTAATPTTGTTISTNNSNTINSLVQANNLANLANPAIVPQIRFVTQEFHAVEPDELTVRPHDVVLYQYEDTSPDGAPWCHVKRLDSNIEGFVPKSILSDYRFPRLKKKLPRSRVDSNDHSRHHHHSHHHNYNNCESINYPKLSYESEKLCHSNGGSIRGHFQSQMRDQQPQVFDMNPPNSLQGSSGCQTFPKGYPDALWPPSHLMQISPGHHYVPPYMNSITPFLLDLKERYFVAHNFVAREENDLSVKAGDNVIVCNKDDKDWYWVRLIDERGVLADEGFVPSSFIHPLESVKSIVTSLNKGNSTITMKSSDQCADNYHTYINHRPERDSVPATQQS